MEKSLEELLADLERKAKERISLPSDAADAAETVCDVNETVYEGNDAISPAAVSASSAASESVYPRGRVLLGTYTVDSAPIRGGMGSVWRVRLNDDNRETPVRMAMKRPLANMFLTGEQKQNFIHECEVWMKLGLHRHIVYCYYSLRRLYPGILFHGADGRNASDSQNRYFLLGSHHP